MAKKPKDKITFSQLHIPVTTSVKVSRTTVLLSGEEIENIIIEHLKRRDLVHDDMVQWSIDQDIPDEVVIHIDHPFHENVE